MLRKVVAALAVACAVVPAPAAAARVGVHRVRGTAATELPTVPGSARIRNLRHRARARIAALSPTDQSSFADAMARARAARDVMPAGAARNELSGVISNAQQLSDRGLLTSSRLPAVLLTLQRNREFWPVNPVPAAGSRFTFGTSPVIFEYYPGEGVQVQPLANFGKANAAWTKCKRLGDTACTPLRSILDAMISLASQRGTFTSWEYFFDFEGGVPPWTSAMSQGTGIQALSRAYKLTGDTHYKTVAAAALGAFQTAPPTGVATPSTDGTHYLMYSYAPSLFIFNGFLQSLVGLYDYKSNTGDPLGTTLFRAGNGNGKWLTPQSDTGSWSLYSLGGPESTVEYHTLLRDILKNLCSRTGATVYCSTADRFTQYLLARTG